MSVRAYLVLEDGTVFEGEPRAAFHETVFEAVFNTSMTGYLEILTDPSYAGQGVVMTYPLIGNYGVQTEDCESSRLNVSAFIVRGLCSAPSNFRSEGTLEALLEKSGIPCLSGVDTRAVVKILREHGTMRALLTSDVSDKARCLERIQADHPQGLVESVTTSGRTEFGADGTGPRVAVLDCGVKRSILGSLVSRGCRVTVHPCHTTAQEILSEGVDGILLSNGPGDPKDCQEMIRQTAALYDAGVPMFGIGLGHQLIALSQGGDTQRLKYGHRGGNLPVKDLRQDRTYITNQNHGHVVTASSLPSYACVSHINVNDGTIEGIIYENRPVFSVQYHPETSPAPHNSAYLFDRFMDIMGGERNA